MRTVRIGPFRPSLAGGGARDAPVGGQTLRLRPAAGEKPRTEWPIATIHLASAVARRSPATSVDIVGCRFVVRSAPERSWTRPPVKEHWERDGLREAILAGPRRPRERISRTLTIEDLAPLDQFHGGGLGFTRRLATLGRLTAGMHVLDVGGGLGGPARTLAVEFGCRVTVIDLAESYVDAGRMLTSLMGLDDRRRRSTSAMRWTCRTTTAPSMPSGPRTAG